MAVTFAREGAKVLVADIDDQAGEGVAAAIEASGGSAAFVHADVRDEDDVRAAIEAVLGRWGSLDILVNNAGVGKSTDELSLLETATWDEIINVNLRSVFFGMKHAVPQMANQGGGVILSTSSISALPGYIGSLAYGAAKAGVLKLTVTVAARYASDGIRVNAILPGIISTPLARRANGSPPRPRDDVEARFATLQPIPRSGQPEDVANVALWLASDESSFVTGQAIVVDGGLLIAGPGPKNLPPFGAANEW
jgi:NAD(P)-dependent dehydrogenase (short-subunit alcohol dehydrogenase family)